MIRCAHCCVDYGDGEGHVFDCDCGVEGCVGEVERYGVAWRPRRCFLECYTIAGLDRCGFVGVKVKYGGEVLWAAEQALDADVDLEYVFCDVDFGIAHEVICQVAECACCARPEVQRQTRLGTGNCPFFWPFCVKIAEHTLFLSSLSFACFGFV